jgi:hypothetical protein
VISTQGPSADYLSESGQFSIIRPYVLNKEGYQYITANIRLFVFRNVMIDCFSAILVFLKLKQSQYCQCIMHASKDSFRGLYS